MEIKVKTKLYETFAKIVSKSDDKLSVSDLCEKAGVSRAGFYVHFKDLEDFEDKCREYIIEKLFGQIFTFLENSADPDICDMIFSDTDIIMLRYFTGKHSYWDFAESGNKIIWSNFERIMTERWGKEYFEKNKTTFEFALNGSVASLYFDLLNYDKETFARNMNYVTNIMKDLFPYNK